MPPYIASILFAGGIAFLFYLDRGKKSRVSKALWIPTAWLFLCMTRSVSEWLGVGAQAVQAGVYLEGSPVDAAVLAFLEVLALIVVIRRWRQASSILRANWAIVLFFLFAAASISWSDFPVVTFKHWIKGIGDVMMVLIVLTEPNVTGAVTRLFTRLGFVLLPLSILFIRYYPELGRRLTNSWTLEPVGVCTQKNGLGELCSICGLALLWRFRSAYQDHDDPSRRRRLLALGTVLAMVVWLLWACSSLTSICALSMATAAMMLPPRPAFRHNRAFVHILIVAMLGLSLYATIFQSSGALVEDLGRDATMSGRTTGWALMLSIPNNRLVGTGYETFWLGPRLKMIWEAFINLPVGQAHSGYLEIFLNLGWIGVSLLALLIATGYRNVIGAYRRDPDTGSLWIAYFVLVVASGLTEGVFKMMSPTWIAFLLATAAASIEAATEGDEFGSPANYRLRQAQEVAVHEEALAGY